jgi:uncharacterized repeat protein (TIGR03803 family)
MHSAGRHSRRKGRLNVSDVGAKFGPTNLAAATTRVVFRLVVLSTLLLIADRSAEAQTEIVLYSFAGGSHGSGPETRLTSDGAGNFYGTTASGGLGAGTVFRLSPNGYGGWKETVLYSFCSASNCVDGANPMYSYVTFDGAGNLYGTTYAGGAYGIGVVFELSPVGKTWKETVLYSFPGGTAHGYSPSNGLIMDTSGDLYGTVLGGVFELSPSGGGWTERVIYAVSTGMGGAGLTMDAAGNIFGVGYSKVFELSPNGNGGWNPTVIHTFNAGLLPEGTPVLDQAGNLYGTTFYGGAKGYGTVYKLSRGMTGKWVEKVLYSFQSGIDGSDPWAGIVFDPSGNIYGTTARGGSSGAGTVFELVAPVGTGSYKEKVLWSFNGTDGNQPLGSLILDSAGNLYGTTNAGGSKYSGVVFEVRP